jgi:hypothetical protein
LLAGKVIDADSLRTMLSTTPAYHPYYATERAGLGIMRFDVACADGRRRRAWGHLGGSPAYGDVVLATRDGKKVVILMVNAGNADTGYLPIADAAFCSD